MKGFSIEREILGFICFVRVKLVQAATQCKACNTYTTSSRSQPSRDLKTGPFQISAEYKLKAMAI